MQRFLHIFLLVWMLVLGAPKAGAAPRTPPWEQGMSRGEDLAVSIYVFGPGANLEEWWGHIALAIADRRLGNELFYNWGMFAFDADLVKGFATGRMRFWVATEPVQPSVAFYRRYGRSVRAYDLNLSPEQRLALADAVTRNLRPENSSYDYEYFRDNCATRIRDMLDAVLQGQLAAATRSQPARMTIRDHVDALTSRNPAMAALLGFLLSASIDRPATVWDEMFLPDELVRALLPFEYTDATGKRVRLVANERVIFPGNPALEAVPVRPLFPWDLVAGLVLGALPLALLLWPRVRCPMLRRSGLAISAFLAGVILGIPGTVLFIFNVASNHTYTYWNANVLLGNPLTLSLLVFGPLILWRGEKKRRAAAYLASLLSGLVLAALVIEAIPAWNVQRNGEFVRLATPWILGLTAAFLLNSRLPRPPRTREVS